MKNEYLFIVWNNALFCENKIKEYLSCSFKIKKWFYVVWDKELFYENIMAFYGIKAPDAEDKIKAIGKGSFLIIIVEDLNPAFENRKTYNGSEKVNAKIYDAKRLLRQWTGENFRVHSSQDDSETMHDLTALFGHDYDNLIESLENGTTLSQNTKGVYGFEGIKDLKKCITNFDHSILIQKENKIIIFTKCRTNINYFINPSKANNIVGVISFKQGDSPIVVLGEAEGDIPAYSLEKEEVIDFISDNIDEYINLIFENHPLTDKYTTLFEKNGLETALVKKNPMRKTQKKTFFIRIKDKLRYFKVRYLIR